VRGMGFMVGIEFVANRATKEPFPLEKLVGRKMMKNLLNRGVISRALGNTLVFAPPLVFDRGNIDELVAAFSSALQDIVGEVR